MALTAVAAGPLRILQGLRAPVGGLFRHVYDLTEELAKRGHFVGVVADSLTSDALTGQRLRALAPSIALGTYYFPMPRTIGPGRGQPEHEITKWSRPLHRGGPAVDQRWTSGGPAGQPPLVSPASSRSIRTAESWSSSQPSRVRQS